MYTQYALIPLQTVV